MHAKCKSPKTENPTHHNTSSDALLSKVHIVKSCSTAMKLSSKGFPVSGLQTESGRSPNSEPSEAIQRKAFPIGALLWARALLCALDSRGVSENVTSLRLFIPGSWFSET